MHLDGAPCEVKDGGDLVLQRHRLRIALLERGITKLVPLASGAENGNAKVCDGSGGIGSLRAEWTSAALALSGDRAGGV